MIVITLLPRILDAANRGEEKSDPVKVYRGEEASMSARNEAVTANNHRNNVPHSHQLSCSTATAAAAPAPSQSAPRRTNRNPLLQKSYSQATPDGGEVRQGRPADE